MFGVPVAPTAPMVATEGSLYDLLKSLWDRDQSATNSPPCRRKIAHQCRDIGPHIFVIGERGRLDKTAPKRNGGIKLSGLVLVKGCRTKNEKYYLAGDQPSKNQSGGRRSGRIT